MPCLPTRSIEEVFETVVVEALTRIERKLDALRREVAELLEYPPADVGRDPDDIPF